MTSPNLDIYGSEPSDLTAGWPEPNERHVDMLKKNPHLSHAFEQKFGDGAASRHLGIPESDTGRMLSPQIQGLSYKHEIEARIASQDERRSKSQGVWGDWGKLDDAGRAEWTKAEKDDAEDGVGWWQWANDSILTPWRANLAEAKKRGNNDAGEDDPIFRWAERKIGENIAHQKRRRMLAEEMEAGTREAAKYGAARARVDDVARGAVDLGAHVLKGMGYGTTYLADKPLSKVEENRIHQLGQWVETKSHEWFPKDAARAEEFATKLAEGTGSMLGFLGPAMAVKVLAKAGPRTIGAVAGVEGSLAQSSMVDDARKAYGRDPTPEDEQKLTEVWLASLGIGATEGFPIAHLFAGQKGHFVRRVLSQAAEEGGQEFAQQVAENLVAQAYYDPGRTWDDDAWQGAVIGASLAVPDRGPLRAGRPN